MKRKDERALVSFDWAMQNMLRDKANFDILEGFLRALLEEDVKIQSVLENVTDEYNRVDLLMVDTQGVVIAIAVQYGYSSLYSRHLSFDTAKSISDHIEMKPPYITVKIIISISLLYIPFGNRQQDSNYIYHGRTEFYGFHTGKKLSVRQRNIFPEYYLIEIERFPNEVTNALDEWIYFFKNSKVLNEFRAKNIQTAREKLKLIEMDEDEHLAYEKFLINRAKYQGDVLSAKEEGREKRDIQIACQMLEYGEPLDRITFYTGLSQDEIMQLQEASITNHQ